MPLDEAANMPLTSVSTMGRVNELQGFCLFFNVDLFFEVSLFHSWNFWCHSSVQS